MDNLILVIEILISIIMVISIILYSAWLLYRRIKKGDPKIKNFTAFVKHIFETLWGL